MLRGHVYGCRRDLGLPGALRDRGSDRINRYGRSRYVWRYRRRWKSPILTCPRLCLLATSTAPLQNIVPGWRLGSTGCYDQYTLALLQSAVRNDFTKFAHENAAFCCDTNNIEPEILEMLADETLKADPEALCKLMADHTARDWRDVLGTITVPCLNVVGRVSKVFPWEGVAAVSDKLVSSSDVQTEYFDYNHWLYLESPEQFNELVAGFARSR